MTSFLLTVWLPGEKKGSGKSRTEPTSNRETASESPQNWGDMETSGSFIIIPAKTNE